MYKSFGFLRTEFLALFYAVFFMTLIMPLGVRAQEGLFTITDITVDVTAENAIKAREKAFEQAQTEAFKALAARVMPEADAATYTPPPVSQISGMIADFEVTKEQLSSTRYVGTYTFRFNDADVKSHFGTQNVTYSDVASRPVLILPFMSKGGRNHLWSPFNLWMKAWNGAKDLDKGLVPLVLPLGDLEDVADISDNEALEYDATKLARLTKRYETGEAVMVIAKPDASLSVAEKLEDPAQGTLQIQLYRTDRAMPEFTKELSITAGTGETMGVFLNKAVNSVKTALQQDWKAKTATKTSETMHVNARVPFSSLGQWTNTKRALDRVYGLENLKVTTITPQGARIGFSFRGDESRLKTSMGQAGLVLTGGTPSPVPGAMPGSMPVPASYEVYLQKFAPAGSIPALPVPAGGSAALPAQTSPQVAPATWQKLYQEQSANRAYGNGNMHQPPNTQTTAVPGYQQRF